MALEEERRRLPSCSYEQFGTVENQFFLKININIKKLGPFVGGRGIQHVNSHDAKICLFSRVTCLYLSSSSSSLLVVTVVVPVVKIPPPMHPGSPIGFDTFFNRTN